MPRPVIKAIAAYLRKRQRIPVVEFLKGFKCMTPGCKGPVVKIVKHPFLDTVTMCAKCKADWERLIRNLKIERGEKPDDDGVEDWPRTPGDLH
jgi:hypothetical protein